MIYELTAPQPDSHFLEIKYFISDITTETIEVQLPAWRPGRYELQHFAKNVRTFSVSDHKGNPISFQKITKDRWCLQVAGINEVVISYSYYCNVQNAGTSYVDADLWYLNFVNFCLYTEGRLNEPCVVRLQMEPGRKIACGLEQRNPYELWAADYYELVDCPLLASKTLKRFQYEAKGIPFSIWFQGNVLLDTEKMISDFKAFSEVQLDAMGAFPEKEYHFMNIVLPTPYYHGVEHRNSTMVVLGPDEDVKGLYIDLLGVSSHELYHAWNIIRIRPKELLPYDFTKENYFTTCFVAEGVTTYYGDLFLKRANVFDEAAYLNELLVYMKRHFESASDAALSLTESSYDLWLDGYDKGIPQRKVSVYHKGALVSLILDLYIRKKYNHARSLDTIMKLMWERFGEPFKGYTYVDYVSVVEEVAGESLNWYWERCINGTESLEVLLNEALNWVGLEMDFVEKTVQLRVLPNFEGAAQRFIWLSK